MHSRNINFPTLFIPGQSATDANLTYLANPFTTVTNPEQAIAVFVSYLLRRMPEHQHTIFLVPFSILFSPTTTSALKTFY